jgi:hypothetical protein
MHPMQPMQLSVENDDAITKLDTCSQAAPSRTCGVRCYSMPLHGITYQWRIGFLHCLTGANGTCHNSPFVVVDPTSELWVREETVRLAFSRHHA